MPNLSSLSEPVSNYPWLNNPLNNYYEYIKSVRETQFFISTDTFDLGGMLLQTPDIYYRNAPKNSAGYTNNTADKFYLLIEEDITEMPIALEPHNAKMDKVMLVCTAIHEANHCITRKSFGSDYEGLNEGMTEFETKIFTNQEFLPSIYSQEDIRILNWFSTVEGPVDGWDFTIKDIQGYYVSGSNSVQAILASYIKERRFAEQFMSCSVFHEYALRMAYQIGANHIADAVIEAALGSDALKIMSQLENYKGQDTLYDYNSVKNAFPQLFIPETKTCRGSQLMEAITYGLDCIWPSIDITAEDAINRYKPLLH